MTQNKKKMNRLLLLEVLLAVAGIILISCLFAFAINQQQKIAENLFQHPFAVSNAALSFKADILELRKIGLEVILTRKQFSDAQNAQISLLNNRTARNLAIVRKEFLGDQKRVLDIIHGMDAWSNIRKQIRDNVSSGNFDTAQSLVMNQALPQIHQILNDTEYIITFAQSRAMKFLQEGKDQLVLSRIYLAVVVIISLTLFIAMSHKLRKLVTQLYDVEEHHARFDQLSKTYNRRSLIELGNMEIERAKRYGLPLSLLMMDLDHFKKVNDTYGHDAGDAVLCQFSIICNQQLRGTDNLGRIGGEEFVVLLPHSDIKVALEVAERIRKEVADTDFEIAGGKSIKVTVSVGVASLDERITSITDLIKQGDEAMYISKKNGRNRVTVAEKSNI